MNEFEVSNNSWHYRWLTFLNASIRFFSGDTEGSMSGFRTFQGTPSEFYETCHRPYNFCMYWRHVALWPLVRIIVTIALMVAFYVYALSMVNVISLLFGVGAIIAILACIFTLATAVAWVDVQPFKDSGGILATAYRSYKSKYCPYLRFTK